MVLNQLCTYYGTVGSEFAMKTVHSIFTNPLPRTFRDEDAPSWKDVVRCRVITLGILGTK